MSEAESGQGFAARLRVAMEAARKTPGDLVTATGVRAETVSRWLNGTRHPKRRHLHALSALLNRPITYFEEPVTEEVVEFIGIGPRVSTDWVKVSNEELAREVWKRLVGHVAS